MKIFCIHEWEIHRHVIPSPASKLESFRGTGVPRSFFSETVITDLICDKCGKHKHYKDSNE